MATVADLVVHELSRAGVRAIFGVPGGGGNLDLIAAAGRAGLPFVLTATETAAAIAALAQAEITGRPGACLTTIGPGATSVVNGVACALLDRVPLVVFTDGYPAAVRGVYEHQRLDHAALFRTVAKSSETLSPERPAGIVADALRLSLSNRPGPVHVECPGDVASQEVSAAPEPEEGEGFDPVTATIALARFEATVSQSRKPLVIAGLGARRPADADAVRRLCETRHLPAMVTYKGKGIVPDDHPWFGGVFTNAAVEQPLIDESDLLIGIGLDPVELLPRPWAGKPPIVYCGQWSVEAAHVPFVAQHVTEVADGVIHLRGVLPETDWRPDRVQALVREQQAKMLVPAGGLTAQRVVQVAAARLAFSAGRVTVDAGAHMLPATVLWPAAAPGTMLISNGLSTMGFALPAAIGAALLDRQRAVVALTGDGGLLMCAGELVTAAREGLRIIVIVFNDASLSLIEIKQQSRGLPAAGVALGAVDWVALARGCGVDGAAARSEAELDTALQRAADSAGPFLIEAKIDRSNYGAMLKAVRGK